MFCSSVGSTVDLERLYILLLLFYLWQLTIGSLWCTTYQSLWREKNLHLYCNTKEEQTRGSSKLTTKEDKSCLFGFQDKFTLVSYVPKKKKEKAVLAISTMHNNGTIDLATRNETKPVIITAYNGYKIWNGHLRQNGSTIWHRKKLSTMAFGIFFSPTYWTVQEPMLSIFTEPIKITKTWVALSFWKPCHLTLWSQKSYKGSAWKWYRDIKCKGKQSLKLCDEEVVYIHQKCTTNSVCPLNTGLCKTFPLHWLSLKLVNS